MYEPSEDSYLLAECVKKYAVGSVLDVGTGSGIQAATAVKVSGVKKVVGVDVDKKVIEHCKEMYHNIHFRVSDLFNKVQEKFDTIIFNPPYLPGGDEVDLSGGKKGYEFVMRFLHEVNGYLKPDGIVLLLFSSLTKKKVVEQLIEHHLLDYEEVARKRIFFEELYVYKLTKKNFLKELEQNGLSQVGYYNKGKRGLVYKAMFKEKSVIVKYTNPKSKAVNRIEYEAGWLKRLHKKKIGSGLVMKGDGWFVSRFVDGEEILAYFDTHTARENKDVVRKVFTQCFEMDKMGVDKEEMHHPVKHILVEDGKPVMIDFERTHATLKPKNVTQFCQFVVTVSPRLKWKVHSSEIQELAKQYKQEISQGNFLKIVKAVIG